MEKYLTEEQEKHVMNIILSCERFAKLQTMIDSLNDDYPEFASENKYLTKRMLAYSDYLWSEYKELTGKSFDELNPYEHTADVDLVTKQLDSDV